MERTNSHSWPLTRALAAIQGGQEFRLPIEQEVAFLGDRTVFLDGRQTRFHLIR
mgnify:CR=1 FL=1